MASEEHLAILRRGVKEWNRWREDNPRVRIDLRGAELAGTNLSVASLWGVHLDGACLDRVHLVGACLEDTWLEGASLSSAYLEGARLAGARLAGAQLKGARLDDACLESADLVRACFDGARLNGACLNGARLDGACLARVSLSYTFLANIDLSRVKGLESVQHDGPSPISTSTLERSRGQVPDIFLRGCGLSDWEIEAARLYNTKLDQDERRLIHQEIMRLQGEQPIMHTRLFISYSHRDSKFVEALEPLLDSKGVRYWRDVHDMRAGRMETQIDRG